MKIVFIVAIFAFVAVQLSHSKPTPDDDNKDAGGDHVSVDAGQPAEEVKSAPSEVSASAAPVDDAVHAEEKKA